MKAAVPLLQGRSAMPAARTPPLTMRRRSCQTFPSFMAWLRTPRHSISAPRHGNRRRWAQMTDEHGPQPPMQRLGPQRAPTASVMERTKATTVGPPRALMASV